MANISPLLMTRLIGQLTGAIRNLKMYDVKHATSQKLFENSLQAIKEAMGTDPSFSFSLAGNILQINGKPVPDSRKEAIANFIGELGKRSIGHLSFLQGIDRDQIQAFFEVMAVDPEKVKGQGGIGRLLQAKGVKSIQVRGISYVGEDEGGGAASAGISSQDLQSLAQMPAQLLTLIRSNPGAVARMIIENSGGGDAAESAMSQLDAMAGALAGSADQTSKEYVGGMAQVVAGLDQGMQQQVVLRKTLDPDWVEIVRSVISKYSDGDILALINQRMQALKQMGFKGDWAEELKRIWNGLPLEPQRKNSLLPAFSQRLVQYGFSQEDRQYILGQEPPPEEQARQITEQLTAQTGDRLFNPAFMGGVLRAVRRGVSSPELWQALGDKYSDSQEETRKLALQYTLDILKALLDAGRSDLAEQFVEILASRLSSEYQSDLLQQTILQMGQVFAILVKHDKKAIAAKSSQALAAVFPYLIDKPVAETMLKVLGEMADENSIKALIKGFIHRTLFERIAEIMVGIGHPAIHWLMDTLRDSEDKDFRMKAMYVLSKIGGDAESEAVKILSLEDRWFVKRNLALVLGQIGTDACLEQLRKTYEDKDPRVKIEVLRAVHRIAAAQVEDLLIRGLLEKEEAVKKTAIELLTKSASDAGTDALAELYGKKDILGRGETPEIKMAIIEAAGAIGTKRAANLLMTAARDKEPQLSQRAQEILRPLLKKIKEQEMKRGEI
jgi:HEAT repeat protein